MFCCCPENMDNTLLRDFFCIITYCVSALSLHTESTDSMIMTAILSPPSLSPSLVSQPPSPPISPQWYPLCLPSAHPVLPASHHEVGHTHPAVPALGVGCVCVCVCACDGGGGVALLAQVHHYNTLQRDATNILDRSRQAILSSHLLPGKPSFKLAHIHRQLYSVLCITLSTPRFSCTSPCPALSACTKPTSQEHCRK